MKIASIDAQVVRLPFRFAVGHSLAVRAQTANLIVRVRLDDGTEGYGESVPRKYVTGESADEAARTVASLYAPRFAALDVSDRAALPAWLDEQFASFGLLGRPGGASWCALELAVLDAVAKAHALHVADWLGPVKTTRIRYGAVVPFLGRRKLAALLWFYRVYGFKTVKVKVGRRFEEDAYTVALARQILGPGVTIRLDANCAWTPDEAIRAAERLRPFAIASIEQPVAAGDLEGMACVAASIPEEVVADESLCTVEQAAALAGARACSGFNIRLSKVGGFLPALKIIAIADGAGINCHLGAQVGESGILSAASRAFACTQRQFSNYEGSFNWFLLKGDLTGENLTVGYGGWGALTSGCGWGVSIDKRRLSSFAAAPDKVCGACEPGLVREHATGER